MREQLPGWVILTAYLLFGLVFLLPLLATAITAFFPAAQKEPYSGVKTRPGPE